MAVDSDGFGARNTAMSAHFITFEGGEGAGKSTQIRRLQSRLEGYGKACIATREPGGAPGAEAIRALLVQGDGDRWDAVTDALLFTAARRDHCVRTIWPALQQGVWVLSDRFFDSSRAYQGVGLGLGINKVDELTRFAIGDFKPDLTIILDLPVEEGLARAMKRTGQETRYESLGLEFHERQRQAFLDFARVEPDRFIVLDARASIDMVEDVIWQAVTHRFGL